MNAAMTSASRNADPDRAAGLPRDLADERVDAAAEDVADDEEQQQARRDRALQPAALGALGHGRRRRRPGCWGCVVRRVARARSYPTGPLDQRDACFARRDAV